MIVTVLGAGRMGTALAHLLGQREEVYLWGRSESLIKQVQFDRVNEAYLPGVKLPYEVRATYDLEHALNDSDLAVMAVPSSDFVEVFERTYTFLSGLEGLVSVTAGYDPETGRRLSQEVLERCESLDDYYFLTGGGFPEEIGYQQPTAWVLAGGRERTRRRLSEWFFRPYFRVHPTGDLIGAEVVSALKQVYAIVGGLSDGTGYDAGTRADLVTRAFHETLRFVDYEGGDRRTVEGFAGLAGLVAGCTSELSVNYRLGRELAAGGNVEEVRARLGVRLPGLHATKVAYHRAIRAELRAPLVSTVFGVLFDELPPEKAMERLFRLDTPPEGPGGTGTD